MAQVTITIPDEVVPRVRAALRAAHPEWDALTDAQVFRRVVAEHVRALVVGYEQAQAQEQAQATVDAAAQAALDDTAGIG